MSDPANLRAHKRRESTDQYDGILKLLPHRYPMLLIDRIIHIIRTNGLSRLRMLRSTSLFRRPFSRYPIAEC